MKKFTIVKPRGLGDVVETLTKYTGIKAVSRFLFKDCGCDRRRDELNRRVPFAKMTKGQVDRLEKALENGTSTLHRDQVKEVYAIYNEIFSTSKRPRDCTGKCTAKMIEEMISLAGLCEKK